MKMKWLFWGIILIITVSCSRSPEERADDLSKELMARLSDSFASETFRQIIIDFNKSTETEKNMQVFLNSFGKQFLRVKYEKLINRNSINHIIQGSAMPYMKIADKNLKIELTGDGSGMYSILLSVILIKKYGVSAEVKVEGYILIIDSSDYQIGKYPIYHVPDFNKLLDSTFNQITFRIMLENCWNGISGNPLEDAMIKLMKIESFKSIEVHLDLMDSHNSINNTGTKSNNDSDYEEMLKKLEDKH